MLDDQAKLAGADPSGMLETALGFARQIRDGWRLGGAARLPALPRRPEHLVVCGMGGSAIGGDLLAGYLAPAFPIPITVVRGYEAPAFVGPRSLVIAVSYSGATEETLAAVAQAERAGASLCAITSGGPLEETARRSGVVVPGGLAPAPRSGTC